jgi:1A family penicillin-binding protein
MKKMSGLFQHKMGKWTSKDINISYISLVTAVIILGSLLLSLYLPLPQSQMPIATEVYDQNHKLVTTFFLENRSPVTLDEVPPFLINAILAVEDHRFYQHHGINIGRIFKALVYDIIHHSWEQGASTITQQLAKNAYLNQERNFFRKLQELFYTIKLELHFSKAQILELYLNQIYFGHGAYGLKIAAQTYFDKDLNQLNQSEMALLAGLPKGPAYYSPYNHPRASRQRITEVLQRMQACRYISANDFRTYLSQPLHTPGLRTRIPPAPYFLDLLQDEVNRIFPKKPGFIYKAGLIIESTLDMTLQKTAEQSMQEGLPILFHDKQNLLQPQGALIAIDSNTGAIRALVGGRDAARSQFNRAIQAHRQPGSAFKPILYAAALNHGYTLANQIDCAPVTYQWGNHMYRPTDAGNENASGLLSLRDALAASSNVVAVKLLNQIGTASVINLAKSLGIHSILPPELSLALGSGEVTPLELAGAYLPFASGGKKITPSTIRRILDREGRVLYQAPAEHTTIINPGVAYLVTQALNGVLHKGGTAANIEGILDRPAAGKTGTTQDNHDAWFVGYTPELLTCVYVGCDHNERPLPGAANTIAAPIWANFTARALAGKPSHDFTIPSDVVKVNICSETGARATAFCPQKPEYFIIGTEPTEYCEKHRYINLEVCKRSGLLPSPYCRDLEIRQFQLGRQPAQTCDICRKHTYLFDWLRRIFRH